MTHEKVWRNFDLGENNPDPGRAILLSAEHPLKRLISYRRALVDSLIKRGIMIKYFSAGFDYQKSKDFKSSSARIEQLLIKLSNVNNAIEYSYSGMRKMEGFTSFADSIRSTYVQHMLNNDHYRANHTLNNVGKTIVNLLRKSDHYKPLPFEVKQEVKSLYEFISRQNSIKN